MDSSNNTFVFPETDLKLAKLVLEIARELDPNVFIINISENDDIPNDINVDIESMNEDECNCLELKEKIKDALKYDAKACYKKAYELCGNIDNYDANELRHSTYSYVEGLTYNEQITICKNWLKYLEDPNCERYETRGGERARVNRDIARLQNKALNEFRRNGVDTTKSKITEILNGYENTLREGSASAHDFYTIIQFCETHNLNQKLRYWINEFIRFFEENNKNYGHWGVNIFQWLMKYEGIDEAERFLEKYEKQEELLEQKGKHNHLHVINSYKYIISYHRKGIKIPFVHIAIEFFDYLKCKKKEEYIRFKKKYVGAIEKHRNNLLLIQAYNQAYKCGGKEYSDRLFDDYLEACLRDIDVIPVILECIDELIEMSKDNRCELENSNLSADKFKIAGCDIFVKLERYYSNQGMYKEDLVICDKAIDCGYLDDGTKAGMMGRKARIQKKYK